MSEVIAPAHPVAALGPVDALLFDQWREVAPGSARQRVMVIDAPQLADAVARVPGVEVSGWCDDLRDELALSPAVRRVGFDAEGFAGVELVLLRLPKSLAALNEYCAAIAQWADPGVLVFGGAREKHLNRSMNEVLARHFATVSASRGRQKSRVLRASGPLEQPQQWPQSRRHEALGLTLWAHGGTFAGTNLDAGTRLLLDHLPQLAAGCEHPETILDVGSGNGVIAASLARQYPHAQVSAIDVSWAGAQATRRTAEANGLTVAVTRADGVASKSDASLDLIVTNPPFHVGTAKDSAPTLAIFTDAARVLRPGGQLWCVFNSHLPWLRELRRRVGPSEVIVQNRNYFVTRSISRGRSRLGVT